MQPREAPEKAISTLVLRRHSGRVMYRNTAARASADTAVPPLDTRKSAFWLSGRALRKSSAPAAASAASAFEKRALTCATQYSPAGAAPRDAADRRPPDAGRSAMYVVPNGEMQKPPRCLRRRERRKLI